MTQSDFGTIDPTTTSGPDLATALDSFRDALNTHHRGASRPSYAQYGTLWVKNVSAVAQELYFYDGTDDILLLTVDTTNNRMFMPGGVLFTSTLMADNANNAVIDPTSGTPPQGFSWDGTNFQLTLNHTGTGGGMKLARHDNDGSIAVFYRNNASVGSISVTTTATAFNTSSDYRLKYDIEPLVTFDIPASLDGPLAKLMKLAPKRFHMQGDDGAQWVYGFIAHELQAEIPTAVTGEKDAVEDVYRTETNDDGTTRQELAGTAPVYQGVDTSKLVALLVASVQQLTLRVLELETK